MIYDLIIVGAGPSGLATAIQAHKAGLKYVVLEKGSIVNSLQHFPSGMTFFSTPDLLEIGEVPFTSSNMRPSRAEGIEYYTRVAEHFQLMCHFYETVKSISKSDNKFVVKTSRTVHMASNIVLATGYFEHPNTLGIPGEELSKVSHYYTEPFPYYRQRVLVIGAKNSAAIAALELYHHGALVTLVHRGETLSEKIKYWILPDIENRIREGSVKALFHTQVVEIKEKSVTLKTREEEFEIENDFVFALTGYHPDHSLFAMCGIEVDSADQSPKINPSTYETNVSGLYVAGSIIAGNNTNSIFIENGRHHGKVIVDAIIQHLQQ